MPLYEYSCPQCNHRFDLLRSFQEAGKDAFCPRCGTKAKRVISPFAISGTHIHILSPVAEERER